MLGRAGTLSDAGLDEPDNSDTAADDSHGRDEGAWKQGFGLIFSSEMRTGSNMWLCRHLYSI